MERNVTFRFTLLAFQYISLEGESAHKKNLVKKNWNSVTERGHFEMRSNRDRTSLLK